MRTAAYTLIYFVALQLLVGVLIPESWVYNYRVDYESVKNDMDTGLHLAMDRIAAEIRQNPDREYVILLGDSVTYSGPGEANQSIGYYLEEWSRQQGRPLRVYNLAEPGMMGGDTYAEVLMLMEHGIPANRIVINQVYSHFVTGTKEEAIIGWLGDELRRLDPEGWAEARGELLGQKPWTIRFRESLLGALPLWQYRDILRAQIFRQVGLTASGEVKDVRPWTQKKAWLLSLMRQPLYQRFVDPRPLDLTPAANAHVRMLERIIAKTNGQAMFWFSPVNQGLMAEWVKEPGYHANLRRIDAWFKERSVRYVNMENAVDTARFTDHVHMTPEGYRQVAVMLGQQLISSTAKAKGDSGALPQPRVYRADASHTGALPGRAAGPDSHSGCGQPALLRGLGVGVPAALPRHVSPDPSLCTGCERALGTVLPVDRRYRQPA